MGLFSHDPPAAERQGGDPSRLAMQPTTAIDPVTREDVPTASALSSVYQGRIYYFANAESRQRFEASPVQFAREAFGVPIAAPQSAPESRPRRRGGC